MGFRVEARQVPVQSVSIFLLIKMAPRESDAVYTSFTPTLKVADKALDLPVVSDAVSEITKITAPIAPYFEEGIRIIKDKADESLSETIKDKVGSCVTSLDTLACDGLDQLISAVPSLRSATPDLVETTKETASNYVDMMEEYVASFGIAQFCIRLVDIPARRDLSCCRWPTCSVLTSCWGSWAFSWSGQMRNLLLLAPRRRPAVARWVRCWRRRTARWTPITSWTVRRVKIVWSIGLKLSWRNLRIVLLLLTVRRSSTRQRR